MSTYINPILHSPAITCELPKTYPPKFHHCPSSSTPSRNGAAGDRFGSVSGSLVAIRRRVESFGPPSGIALPGGQPDPKGNRGFAGQGPQMLRPRQRFVPGYDGEILRKTPGIQAPSGTPSSPFPGDLSL